MATNYIRSISFQRLRNSHHIGFHSKVLEEIDKYQYDSLGIDDELYARYKSAIGIEQDIVNRSRGSEYTALMADLDTKRDNLFRQSIFLLRAVLYGKPTATITSEIMVGLQSKIIDVYPSTIADAGNQEETAKIRGYIKDMNLFFSEVLSDLGVASVLTELESVNDEYETAFMERIREQAAATNTSESRGNCDDAYMQISFYINSMANIVTTETALLVKAKLCNKVVDETNELINYYMSHYYSKATTESAETSTENTETEENKTPAE